MRVCIRALALLACALLPVAASAQTEAQSSITGVVRDASGAVLPGVTVEAASPALIEKVRTVVTNGIGQYRIINLQSGIYSRDLHAERVQHVQTRRDPAGRRVRRDGQRGHESRRLWKRRSP